jgi:hypothetical protein
MFSVVTNYILQILSLEFILLQILGFYWVRSFEVNHIRTLLYIYSRFYSNSLQLLYVSPKWCRPLRFCNQISICILCLWYSYYRSRPSLFFSTIRMAGVFNSLASIPVLSVRLQEDSWAHTCSAMTWVYFLIAFFLFSRVVESILKFSTK